MVDRSPIPFEPNTPDWFKRFALRNEQAWVPLYPLLPVRVPGFATADLPSAAAYRECVAFDRTLGTLVYSDGSNWVAV